MSKLTTRPVWQQYALVLALLLPWIALAVFTTDVLPEPLRFKSWPETLRTVATALFGVFMVADAIFAVICIAAHMTTQRPNSEAE